MIDATVRRPDAPLMAICLEEDQPDNLQKLRQLSELMVDLGLGWSYPQQRRRGRRGRTRDADGDPISAPPVSTS